MPSIQYKVCYQTVVEERVCVKYRPVYQTTMKECRYTVYRKVRRKFSRSLAFCCSMGSIMMGRKVVNGNFLTKRGGFGIQALIMKGSE